MKQTLSLIALIAAAPAIAEDTRQLGAHEHGVGALNIAVEGTTVTMEFEAPGADIVGFEYAAESAEDRAAIDTAVATLARPLDLFVMPVDAACTVTQASAELESEDAHDDHGDHAEHAGHEAHDDHDDHAGHAHDDHDDHAEHADGAQHTEFHAAYTLDCAKPEALTEITFAYFDTFENAREVEVQIVSASGAQAFEMERSAPTLDLRGLF